LEKSEKTLGGDRNKKPPGKKGAKKGRAIKRGEKVGNPDAKKLYGERGPRSLQRRVLGRMKKKKKHSSTDSPQD